MGDIHDFFIISNGMRMAVSYVSVSLACTSCTHKLNYDCDK